MRARYKAPAGTGIIELGDESTVKVLFDELRNKTGISRFTVRYGPPMAMKTLESSEGNARSLGLNGETLTIVPEEAPPASSLDVQSAAQSRPSQPTSASRDGPEEAHIPWPDREGTLCK